MSEQPVVVDDDTVVTAFAATMAALRSAGLVVLLRPKALTAPSVFDGDVDVLYDPDRFDDVLHVAMTEAGAHGVSLLLDQTAPVKRRITFLAASASHQILLELWPHAEVLPADRSGPAGVVTWAALAPRLVRLDGHQVALPTDVEVALYLAHLHHKRKSLDSPEVQDRLVHYHRRLTAADDDPVAAALAATVEGLTAGQVDLAAGNVRANEALRELGVPVRPTATATAWWQRARRAARRRLRPAGRRPAADVVPVVGADGVGKTTLTELLATSAGTKAVPFKHVFRHALLYRALHRVLRRRPGPQKNLLDERMVQLLLVIARLRWPWFARTQRRRAGGRGPALVDRYFWDYLLRLRDADRPPERVGGYALHTWLAPTPRRAIVLTCRPETLLARKQELTPRAIDALYAVYVDQVTRTRVGRTLILSTESAPEVAADTAATFLTDR